MVIIPHLPNELVAVSGCFRSVLYLRWSEPENQATYELYWGKLTELLPESWGGEPAAHMTIMQSRLEITSITRKLSPATGEFDFSSGMPTPTRELDTTTEVKTTKGVMFVPTWRELLHGHWLLSRGPLWKNTSLHLLHPYQYRLAPVATVPPGGTGVSSKRDEAGRRHTCRRPAYGHTFINKTDKRSIALPPGRLAFRFVKQLFTFNLVTLAGNFTHNVIFVN